MPIENLVQRRGRVRRVLRVVAIMVGALLLVTVIAVAAMVRPDIPLAKLMPKYGVPPSKFVEIGGMQIRYRDEGAGPPLVLLHGFGSSLDTWDGWVRQFAGRRRVIRLDLPGFGLTGPAPDGNYTAALCRRRHRVARQARSRAHRYRRQFDGRAHRADVRACAPGASPQADPGRRRCLPWPEPPLFKLAKAPIVGSWLVRNVTPRFAVQRNLETVYGTPSRLTGAVVDRYWEMTLRAGNRGAIVGRITGPPDPSFGDQLSKVKAPVPIQWGKLDRWIPLSDAYGFQRGIAGSTLRIYPTAGYVPMEELPEATARDADAFLGSPD